MQRARVALVVAFAALLPEVAWSQSYRIYSSTLKPFSTAQAMGEVVIFVSNKRLIAVGTATGLQPNVKSGDFKAPRLGPAAMGPAAYMMAGGGCSAAKSFGMPDTIGQPGDYTDVWKKWHSYLTNVEGDTEFSVVVRALLLLLLLMAIRFDNVVPSVACACTPAAACAAVFALLCCAHTHTHTRRTTHSSSFFPSSPPPPPPPPPPGRVVHRAQCAAIRPWERQDVCAFQHIGGPRRVR